MARVASKWIGAALVLGYAVVLLPPALLFWNVIRPAPWNPSTVKIQFQAIRYDRAGLVFTYSVQNMTHRTARFTPGETEIRALQPSSEAPVGWPNVRLPLELPADAKTLVELRLEMATPKAAYGPATEDQTKRVLQNAVPGGSTDRDPPVSPLPMRGGSAPQEGAAEAALFSVRDTLVNLEGFELVDQNRGIRLVFPRGW